LKRLDVEHKTEVAASVNIQNGTDLAAHAARCGNRSCLCSDGARSRRSDRRLSRMIRWWAAVLVGAGGTLGRVYQDFAVQLAPVSERRRSPCSRGKRLAMVRGYRNLPAATWRGCARGIGAVSLPSYGMREAEINPLIVKAQGVVAVDARLVLK